MKHDPMVTANATAVTTAIIFVVCRLLVSLFPGLMFGIAQSWFHDIKLTQLKDAALAGPTLLLGLVSATLAAWLVGYLFASLYNYFLKK